MAIHVCINHIQWVLHRVCITFGSKPILFGTFKKNNTPNIECVALEGYFNSVKPVLNVDSIT